MAAVAGLETTDRDPCWAFGVGTKSKFWDGSFKSCFRLVQVMRSQWASGAKTCQVTVMAYSPQRNKFWNHVKENGSFSVSEQSLP